MNSVFKQLVQECALDTNQDSIKLQFAWIEKSFFKYLILALNKFSLFTLF